MHESARGTQQTIGTRTGPSLGTRQVAGIPGLAEMALPGTQAHRHVTAHLDMTARPDMTTGSSAIASWRSMLLTALRR